MDKAYTRIRWENEPSTDTPLNETNLNLMDAAINELDNRIIVHDTEIQTLDGYQTAAATSAANAANSATAAANSATAANTSKTNAATSATNASGSATAAANSATAAATSATNAANSATAASTSATNAATSATNASDSATAAANSATAAATSTTNAEIYATRAGTSEQNASDSETAAATSETNANDYMLQSRSWAIGSGYPDRTDQVTNNSKYYAEQSSSASSQCASYLQQVQMYTNLVVPNLLFDPETGYLYVSQTGNNVEFQYDDESGILYYKFIANT